MSVLNTTSTSNSTTTCTTHALILHTLTRQSAFSLWINLLCICLPYTLLASYFCASQSRRHYHNNNNSSSSSTSPSRSLFKFGTPEKYFVGCTIIFLLNASIFFVMVLAIQAQRYCVADPVGDVAYGIQWIVQVLLAGGVVGSAGVCVWNCAVVVFIVRLGCDDGTTTIEEGGNGEGRSGFVDGWVVWKVEGYVLASPVIAVTMVLLFCVRWCKSKRTGGGGGGGGGWKAGIVKEEGQRWWWRQREVWWKRAEEGGVERRRRWWGAKRTEEVFVVPRETTSAIITSSTANTTTTAAAAAERRDLEQGHSSLSSPRGKGRKVAARDWPLQAPANAVSRSTVTRSPPPYASEDPLA